MAIPKKVTQRLAAGIKQFRPILEEAKARDINEAAPAIRAPRC